MEPVAGLPDLVFTANAGLVDGRRFVVSRFRHQERRGEAKHDAEWFAANGSEVLEIRAEPDICFEGAGDALPFGRSLLAGYRFRSDFKAHSLLAEMLSIPVLSVELVDARFYHLDLTFCPLDSRRAIVNPHAWDRYGRTVVERLVPEPLVLELDEALSFCANSVVIGQNIVMPACPPRVGRILEGWGFNVCVSPVTRVHEGRRRRPLPHAGPRRPPRDAISPPSWHFALNSGRFLPIHCDEDPEQDRRHGASKHLVSVRRGGCIAMASARSQARSNLPRQDAEALAEEDAAKAAEAAAAKAATRTRSPRTPTSSSTRSTRCSRSRASSRTSARRAGQ